MDIPEKIGKYKILEEIARGGMGIVYKALDEDLNRFHAAKMLPAEFFANDEHKNRFELEARIVAKLDHPNIMKVYSIERSTNTVWIIMEYLEGDLLIDKIQTTSPLSSQESIKILRQIANALAYAHNNGIIHRDIKPANIMIKKDGTVKIMDFGIARDEDRNLNLTQEGTIIGTPKYMSPEQFSGENIDKRTDIYSLGIVAYEMLSGKVPFNGKTIAQIAYQHMHEKVPSLPKSTSITGDLKQFLKKSLEKKKADRLNTLELAFHIDSTSFGTKKTKLKLKTYKMISIFLIILISTSLLYLYLEKKQSKMKLQKKSALLVKDIEKNIDSHQLTKAKNLITEFKIIQPDSPIFEKYQEQIDQLEFDTIQNNKAKNIFSKALESLKNDEISQYKKLLQEAIETFPENKNFFTTKAYETEKNLAWQIFLEASNMLKQNNVTDFSSLLEKANKIDSNGNYLKKGEKLLNDYNIEQANEHYKEAIRLASQNDFEKSNHELNRCIKLNPQHEKAYYQLSENIFEIDEGISTRYCNYLELALKITPSSKNSENMWKNLAQAYSELGEMKNAISTCKKALTFFPNSQSLINLSKILRLNDQS